MKTEVLANNGQTGQIVSVRGSVVDVCFDEELPPLQTMLRTGADEKVVLEVMSQLDAAHVRAVTLTPTQGTHAGTHPSLGQSMGSGITTGAVAFTCAA